YSFHRGNTRNYGCAPRWAAVDNRGSMGTKPARAFSMVRPVAVYVSDGVALAYGDFGRGNGLGAAPHCFGAFHLRHRLESRSGAVDRNSYEPSHIFTVRVVGHLDRFCCSTKLGPL